MLPLTRYGPKRYRDTKADGRAQAAVATQYPASVTIDTAGADGDLIEVSLGALTVKA